MHIVNIGGSLLVQCIWIRHFEVSVQNSITYHSYLMQIMEKTKWNIRIRQKINVSSGQCIYKVHVCNCIFVSILQVSLSKDSFKLFGYSSYKAEKIPIGAKEIWTTILDILHDVSMINTKCSALGWISFKLLLFNLYILNVMTAFLESEGGYTYQWHRHEGLCIIVENKSGPHHVSATCCTTVVIDYEKHWPPLHLFNVYTASVLCR